MRDPSCEQCKQKFWYYGLDEPCSHHQRQAFPAAENLSPDHVDPVRLQETESQLEALRTILYVAAASYKSLTGKNMAAAIIDWTKDAAYAPIALDVTTQYDRDLSIMNEPERVEPETCPNLP